jgi:hypothetical protein
MPEAVQNALNLLKVAARLQWHPNSLAKEIDLVSTLEALDGLVLYLAASDPNIADAYDQTYGLDRDDEDEDAI